MKTFDYSVHYRASLPYSTPTHTPGNGIIIIVQHITEKTLQGPLDCKEFKTVIPKGNQPWIFIGMTDAEAEAPTLWPTYAKSRLIGKDPDAGEDWRQKEKGVAEDQRVK